MQSGVTCFFSTLEWPAFVSEGVIPRIKLPLIPNYLRPESL